MPIYPISFSIPEEKIVKSIPKKTKLFADYKPNDNRKYTYSSEDDYYKGYQEAVFGYTQKKAGWDCMRHYEILANGCIPYFEGIQEIPPFTMKDFPRELVKEAMANANMNNYQFYVEKLLAYTRENLTTVARAKQLLATIGKPNAKSVLFLGTIDTPDYMRTTLLHGFKMLLKEKCVDFISVPHIYDNYPKEQLCAIYGNGFTYTRGVPSEYDTKCDRENIQERIRNHEFDVIIYGSVHMSGMYDIWKECTTYKDLLYIDIVRKHYQDNEIAYVCGQDIHACTFMIEATPTINLFVREL
jgi:hypothetical protein